MEPRKTASLTDTGDDLDNHRHSSAALLPRLEGRQPRIAIVLGSGLGELADSIQNAAFIPYLDLPGFPQPGVAGHAGRLVVGELNGVAVACMQGRMHYYEGHRPAALAIPIRALQAVGCETLVLTNAAGSLSPAMPPGSLMLLNDHINWAGVNPLIGPNDERVGPRFFDMTRAYDPDLRTLMHEVAAAEKIDLHDGVYVMYPGPNFETPAEIRALQHLGGDAVGMSTVPECLVANHCGMRVCAVSTITNLAAGMTGEPLSHQETLTVGSQTAARLSRLLQSFLGRLA